jgi:hypothetical protein
MIKHLKPRELSEEELKEYEKQNIEEQKIEDLMDNIKRTYISYNSLISLLFATPTTLKKLT